MKYRLVTLFLLVSFVFIAGACSSTTTGPEQPDYISYSNQQPDSTIAWMYFSLDSNRVISPSDAQTALWDIKMPYLKCCGQTKQIDIMLNSGNVGIGSTKGAMVDARFEDLDSVPAGTVLKEDDTAMAFRIVPVKLMGPGIMFSYDITKHTIQPSPDKCLIIQTTSGKLYKFQFTSIYKDAPAAPDMNTPLGYYHFRFAEL
ncbi:MAG: hypothetical protein D8M52_09845 [Chlorobi bacterium]|nr:MAG: hypothetical protein F9K28_09065 [Bacteroidota bacterium]KXK32611.1 MAG: hypothetical protein UZ06_CHB003002043 [Chlorobi bacterium OLB6]MBE2265489.1 HmuY family protein [Flavobacteriales bacterium]MBL1162003.1 hypothetical protein [Chlorobiota bacterium]MBW7854426.1 HmuY family protein [Candidatus Kapabacteria bacterium]MCC6331696.1 HmuY family protein [Ignavibacteria bacterium]